MWYSSPAICRLPATILTLLLLWTATAWAAEKMGKADKVSKADEECVKCHQKLWEAELAKSYIHRPFLEKKCSLCHIEDSALVDGSRGFMSDKGVRWLASQRQNATSHWLTMPLDQVNDMLIVDLRLQGQGNQRREIPLPALGSVRTIKEDRTPPSITEVRLVHLEQGLLVDATIEWQTDEIASSQVRFGENKLNMESKLSEDLNTSHSVTISGLKANKEYQFKVASKDLFANGAESAVFGFSTKGAKSSGNQSAASKPAPKLPLTLQSEFFRRQDQLMIKFTGNQPVMVAVGVPKKEASPEKTAASGARPEQHRLKDAVVTNNTICVPCHGDYVKGSNHPINVPPKPGMEVPADYFLLANGNITCMTCHSAHASDFEYRLVKSSKRELCLGCHNGWI